LQEIANQTRDEFVVDVSNGISWVRGLIVRLNVIPEIIYVSGGELSCLEGQASPFTPSLISVHSTYYQSRITDFKVLEKPAHGYIHFTKQPGIVIKKFTMAQIEGGYIQVGTKRMLLPGQVVCLDTC